METSRHKDITRFDTAISGESRSNHAWRMFLYPIIFYELVLTTSNKY